MHRTTTRARIFCAPTSRPIWPKKSRRRGSSGTSAASVDFVWWHGRNVVAIEVKNGREFRREWKKGIDAFRSGVTAKAFIVYRGERELELEGTRVLPLDTFLRRLHAGEIVG